MKNPKMIYTIIAALLFLYWIYRRSSADLVTPAKDTSNARTVGEWPIIVPVPNPEPQPSPEIGINAYGALSNKNIELWVESNDLISWIEFLIVSEANFLAGNTYSNVIASDLQIRTGQNEVYNFQFLDELQPGDYVVIVRDNHNNDIYSYMYFTIQPDKEVETILYTKPNWLNKLDITRAASTNQTSIWVEPSGLEIRISNKAATPQPTGKNHLNNDWSSETWETGTAEHSGDYSRVYRYNPPVLSEGGILSDETYFIDVRRAAFPNTIFRVEYTVPDSDLMFVSLLPIATPPIEEDEEVSPYLLAKGWEPHIDIQITGTSGNWILNDIAPEPLQTGYDWVYHVNGDIVRGNALLSNYEYKSNAPLQIHKFMLRTDLDSLARWMYPDAGWNIPDAGGTMSGNNSIAFFSCIFK